jgi:hypothetical protein
MPSVPFTQLPDNARVWVFASDRALTDDDARTLLDQVDGFLAQWKAHGAPLRCAREWRDEHFLAIGVDPTVEQASGCSIDGLFRGLRALEETLGTRLVAGGRVFYRGREGRPRVAERRELTVLAEGGELDSGTHVFDTTVTSAHDWRTRFERPAADSWVASLLPADQASQPSSRSATKSSSARNG